MATDTREMRLITKVLALTGRVKELEGMLRSAGLSTVPTEDQRVTEDLSMPQFIAARRLPGEDWSTWDEITIAAHNVTGEVITDVSLRRWAARYGIPETTLADNSGAIRKADYLKALKRAGIVIGS